MPPSPAARWTLLALCPLPWGWDGGRGLDGLMNTQTLGFDALSDFQPSACIRNPRFAFAVEKAVGFLAGFKQHWSILDASINKELLFQGPFALVIAMAMNGWVSAGARLSIIVQHSSKQLPVVVQSLKDSADGLK